MVPSQVHFINQSGLWEAAWIWIATMNDADTAVAMHSSCSRGINLLCYTISNHRFSDGIFPGLVSEER